MVFISKDVNTAEESAPEQYLSSITHPVECIKRRIEASFAVNHLNLSHSVELHGTGLRTDCCETRMAVL